LDTPNESNRAPLKIPERIRFLKRLRVLLGTYESEIFRALSEDLQKPELESYGSEIAPVLEEIRSFERNLTRWSEPKQVGTPWWKLIHWGASSSIRPRPKGRVLIIGPWNYPFHLSLLPVVGAFACGNRVVLKPSELAPATSALLKKLIEEWISDDYVKVIEGDARLSEELTNRRWDHLFFTGGTEIGKKVMRAAANTLTPVTLELGGKSPCILDSGLDIKTSLRRILWGKFYNAGQTCVAPDYLLIPKGKLRETEEAFKAIIQDFYGEKPLLSKDYARIVSRRHFERLVKIKSEAQNFIGGEIDSENLRISPMLMSQPNPESLCMKEEIFGPILPVIEYEGLEEIRQIVARHPHPLALYIFSKNSHFQNQVMDSIPSGGVCINDVLIHLGNSELPFGGIGTSGLGAYHGYNSFKTFSHFQSLERKGHFIDLPQRFPPYKMKLNKVLKWFV